MQHTPFLQIRYLHFTPYLQVLYLWHTPYLQVLHLQHTSYLQVLYLHLISVGFGNKLVIIDQNFCNIVH